jgi:hypothetical protein
MDSLYIAKLTRRVTHRQGNFLRIASKKAGEAGVNFHSSTNFPGHCRTLPDTTPKAFISQRFAGFKDRSEMSGHFRSCWNFRGKPRGCL